MSAAEFSDGTAFRLRTALSCCGAGASRVCVIVAGAPRTPAGVMARTVNVYVPGSRGVASYRRDVVVAVVVPYDTSYEMVTPLGALAGRSHVRAMPLAMLALIRNAGAPRSVAPPVPYTRPATELAMNTPPIPTMVWPGLRLSSKVPERCTMPPYRSKPCP